VPLKKDFEKAQDSERYLKGFRDGNPYP